MWESKLWSNKQLNNYVLAKPSLKKLLNDGFSVIRLELDPELTSIEEAYVSDVSEEPAGLAVAGSDGGGTWAHLLLQSLSPVYSTFLMLE